MCWAVPAKVIEVKDIVAKVNFGGGNIKEVLIGVNEDELKPGDYVLVHAGLIISKINSEQIIETLNMYKEMILEVAKSVGDNVNEISENLDKEFKEWLRSIGVEL